MAHAGANEQRLHWPAIAFARRLEPERRAEIDQRGIDDFATREAGHGVGRTAAQADIVHRDYGAVRSAQDIAGFEDRHAIGAEHLKVGPGAEDFALEPRPAYASTEVRNVPPKTLGRFADDDRLSDLDREVGNVEQARRTHARFITADSRFPQAPRQPDRASRR